MELVSRMMDGSISYELTKRLEPVLSGSGVQREANIELRKAPMLEGCSERQLRSIARIARVFDAPAGTVITRVGGPGNESYLILDGTVSVDSSTGKPVSLGPGEFFSEMSRLDGNPRPATFVSDTPVRLLVINGKHFSAFRREVPDLTQISLVTGVCGKSNRVRIEWGLRRPYCDGSLSSPR